MQIAPENLSANKKPDQRPIDLLADEVAPWWKKNFVYIRKKQVATWKGALVLMFIAGVAAALIWSVKTDYHTSSDAAAASTLYFNPASASVSVSGDFTLDSMINPGVNHVSAVTLHFTFDQTKLRLDSITPSATFSLVLLAASINNTNGTASIDLAVPTANPSITTTSTIATLAFHALSSATNSPVAYTAAAQAAADGEAGNVVTTRTGALVTVNPLDSTPPTGGSITYTNGYRTTATVALTANDGTDISGINTSTRIVQRKSATLTGGTCGTYGSWGAITPTGTYPNLTDATVATGNCYQYRYLVSDNATPANQATYTSVNVIKIDTAGPTGGSMSFSDGYSSKHSIALTLSDGTDAVSGINTTSRIVQRKAATLTGGTCGTYGSWGAITPTGTYPNLTDATVATGNCYQYRYLVSDTAGTQATYTSTNTAKITYSADLSLNGSVDIFDYNLLHQNFANTTCGNIADIVVNCAVDIFDYNQLHADFGQSI